MGLDYHSLAGNSIHTRPIKLFPLALAPILVSRQFAQLELVVRDIVLQPSEGGLRVRVLGLGGCDVWPRQLIYRP